MKVFLLRQKLYRKSKQEAELSYVVLPKIAEDRYRESRMREIRLSGLRRGGLNLRHHGSSTAARLSLLYRFFPVAFPAGRRIGILIPDLIIDELVLADTKVVPAFTLAHTAQMTGYLAVTNLQLAILLNFQDATLQWKRVVRQPGRLHPQ